MRHVARLLILAAGIGVLASFSLAQQPRDKPGDRPKRDGKDGPPGASSADDLVARMMAFDKNKDGKLTKDEITDERLLRLFDRADTNKDGVVTKEELIALAKQLAADEGPGGGRRGGPDGGPGGRGPGGFGGPGGRGPGGFGGPPQPGVVLPPPLQERLNLTAAQKQQLEDLQKDVDSKLGKILTAEQKKQLTEMRERGPGGPGGRGPGGEGDRGRRPGGDQPPPPPDRP